MKQLDFNALASKYLGANSPIQKRNITSNNIFFEDCEEGLVSVFTFTEDLLRFTEDSNSMHGLREFPKHLSAGRNFILGDIKTDMAGNEYYWVKLYQGRLTIEFKLPNLPWIMDMINMDRSVWFSLSLEEMMQRASEIFEIK